MTSVCATDPQAPLVRGMLATVDCTTSGLLGGYGALDGSGLAASLVTGLLTIFIGIMGYRLMLGRMRLDAGELTMTALKLGLVLAVTGSWAVYGPMLGRALAEGPYQIAATMLSRGPIPGSALPADRIDALQIVFDELQRDARSLAGHSGSASPLLGGLAFAAMAVNGSAYLLLLSTLGMLIAGRVIVTFLLALGPVVMGMFLFDATRGIVQGWVRAMLGTAFAPLCVTVMLAVEMAVIEPALVTLAKQRAADAIQPETAMAVSIIILVFALATLSSIGAGFVICRGIRLPGSKAAIATPEGSAAAAGKPAEIAPSLSRVDRIAGAAEAAGRRAGTPAPMTTILRDALAGQDARRATADMTNGATAHLHPATGHHRPRRQLLSTRRR